MGLESYWARHILRDPCVVARVGRGEVTYRIEGRAILHGDRGLLKAKAAEIYRKYYGWLNHEGVRDWCRGAALVELKPIHIERLSKGNPRGSAVEDAMPKLRGAARSQPHRAAKGI